MNKTNNRYPDPFFKPKLIKKMEYEILQILSPITLHLYKFDRLKFKEKNYTLII